MVSKDGMMTGLLMKFGGATGGRLLSTAKSYRDWARQKSICVLQVYQPAMDNPGDDILRLSYDTWEVSSEVSWRGKHLWNLKPKKGYHQPVATVPFAVRLNMLWYFTIFLISDSEPVGAGTPGSSMIAEALEREHWANHQMASRQRSRENLPYVLVHGQSQPAWTAGEMNSRIPSHPPRSSN